MAAPKKYDKLKLRYGAVRANVVLHQSSQFQLKGFIKDHDGNMSSAVRECIEFAAFARETCGSLDRAKVIMGTKHTYELRPDDQLVLQVVKIIKNGK